MSWPYSILAFIVGAVAGYYAEKVLDRVHAHVSRLFQRLRRLRYGRAWETYKSLSVGLDVVQTGWKSDTFAQDEVVLTLGPDFELSSDIAATIRDAHRAGWEQHDLKDNIQVGLSAVDPHRVSDEVGEKTTHQLRLAGQRYHYFDFLATHRTLLEGSVEEKQLLADHISERHSLQPVAAFPNPLSVGLSLFCEDGNCLVLTRRTKLTSSGGTWFGDAVFNAVGENVSLRDVAGYYDGLDRLSPWETAKRGLSEEMGFTTSDVAESRLVLHTFSWDTRILDYKFFGFATSSISRNEVQQRWTFASDRHEAWSLIFVDIKTRRKRANFVRDMVEHRHDWSSEAILCTVRSMLHLFHDLPDGLSLAGIAPL